MIFISFTAVTMTVTVLPILLKKITTNPINSLANFVQNVSKDLKVYENIYFKVIPKKTQQNSSTQ